MAGDLLPVLSTLVPLAIVVAISPLSIVPAVLLVLHTAHPKPTGVAFLVGWLAGLAAVAVVFVELPQVFGGLDRPVPAWANWARILIGIGLLAAGVWRWVTRAQAAPSTLSDSLARVPPGGAAALGFGLTIVNPKVLLMSAAAGFAIGTGGLSAPATSLSVLTYTGIAGSTAIVPIMAYLAAADRLDERLQRAKRWIERHQGALTAVVLLLVGLVLVSTGVADL